MRGVGLRTLTVALFVFALLGGSIARAGRSEDSVRLPVDLGSHHEGPDAVTVVRGDHLWKISKKHLEDRMRRLPANSEVSPYWRLVIDENLDNLRSGDPDLIYPGEVIELPSTDLSEQP